MKKILLSIILLLSNFTFSQNNSDKAIYNLFSLRKTPEISDENKILIIINQLINYGNAFKYSGDLLKGNYVLEKNTKNFKLKILSENLSLLNASFPNKLNKKYKDELTFKKIIAKDQYENEFNDFVLLGIEQYININKILESLNSVSNNFSQVNIIYRDKAFLDNLILGNILPRGNQTRILNREMTRTYLTQQGNGQPASVFLNATDGVIVPVVNGSAEKLFIVDNLWDRIIYSNKDFSSSSGHSPFYSYGYTGTGAGNFVYPSGITYGTLDAQNYRKIFVADFGNNRIQNLGYKLEPWGHSWFLGSTAILKSNLSQPFDISHHPGFSPDWISKEDNILWFSEQGIEKDVKCINAETGEDKFTFNLFQYNGQTFKVNPGRLDTYVEYNSNNQPIRSMLAYVDISLNAIVYFKLDYNGFLPLTNPPQAFWVQQYPMTEKISSVKFVTNLAGTIHPAGVLVTTNDQNDNGHIHINKVINRPDPQTGQFTIPYYIQYVASTGRLILDGYYSEYFKGISNLESQYNYLDIFSVENWTNEYGLRRFKPGVDINNLVNTSYCNGIYRLYWNLKLTNPCKVVFSARFKYTNQTNWNWMNVKLYGIYNCAEEFSLDNGQLQIPIDLQFGSGNNPIGWDQVEITAKFFPLDEPSYSLNSVVETRISNGVNCNSGGGCPYVYVYNGSDFIQDNNILHRSEFIENENMDIEDKYMLRVPPHYNQNDSSYQLKIKELNNDISYFDKFNLISIDHPIGTSLGITENNDYILYFPQNTSSPDYAEYNGNDVTSELSYDSNFTKTVSGEEKDIVSTSFEEENEKGQNNQLMNILRSFFKNLGFSSNKNIIKDKISLNQIESPIYDSVAVLIDPSESDAIIIGPPAKKPAGTISAVDSKDPENPIEHEFAKRQNTSPVIINVGKNSNIDSVVSIWNSDFKISYFAVTQIYYGGYIVNSLDFIEATDSINGNVITSLENVDNIYTTMDSTTNITLKFKNTNGDVPEGFVRDYVLITNGRYEKSIQGNRQFTSSLQNQILEIPKNYLLYQNYPNPFNPITKIKFDLPTEDIVSIKIYDILGKEVYAFKELKKAGYHQINFNGSNLSSGIYIYKFIAGNFVQTKRMVLIK